MKPKIAIQGFGGSFHEEAAMKYFGPDIETVECLTFQDLFDAMALDRADMAVMAIENSVAGSILPNYARLRDSRLFIAGEVYLRIEMNLLTLPGQAIEDIREVHSHPIALLQCHQFFRDHPHLLAVESNDTALSARDIAEKQLTGRGALGSRRAAGLYGLEVLRAGVETNKRNFTRFLVLDRAAVKEGSAVSKASWSFRTAHLAGSLAKVLTLLGEHGINLTKIQSLPVLGEEWKYYFYADLEFSDAAAYREACRATRAHLYDLHILGEYKQGEKYL